MSAGAGQRPEDKRPEETAGALGPAVVVHAPAEAALALALAGPAGVVLLSAPGAAGSLGPAWFVAIVHAAAAARPGVPPLAVLDCADAPGHALAAIRAGLRVVVLAPCPASAAVAGAAADCGAVVWSERPPALDLGRLALDRPGGRALLAAWLNPGGALAPPGLAPPGLAPPGLAPPGLATPGLATPGLATPGLATHEIPPCPRDGEQPAG